MTGTRTAPWFQEALSKQGSPGHSAPREERGCLRASLTHSHIRLQCPPRPGFPSCLCQPHPELVQTGGWGLWAVRPRVGLAGRRRAWPAALKAGLEVKGTSSLLTWALTNRLIRLSQEPRVKAGASCSPWTAGRCLSLQGEKEEAQPLQPALAVPSFLFPPLLGLRVKGGHR